MHTARQAVADIDNRAAMQDDNNRRTVMRTVILLIMLAVGIYIAFIILSILK